MDHRAQRLTEAIREELTEIIAYEMADPRVGGAVVTDVHMSPDKRHAIVRVGIHGGGAPDAIAALEHARGFLRRQLAARLEMFRVPELRFEPEPAAALGSRADFLLRRIRRGRPRDEASPPGGPESAPEAEKSDGGPQKGAKEAVE